MGHVFSAAELGAIRHFWDSIEGAGRDYGFDVSIIVAIGSRESDWGITLRPPGAEGTGDFAKRQPRLDLGRPGPLPPDGGGFGRGLMQIDWDAQGFARTGPWKDPAENVAFGCRVLKGNMDYFRTKLPGWPEDNLLRASVAAYNCGSGNALKSITEGGIQAVDRRTTGGNYSSDVLDRASSFENLLTHGFPMRDVAANDSNPQIDGSNLLTAKMFDEKAA